MQGLKKERWFQLCQQAAVEQDPGRAALRTAQPLTIHASILTGLDLVAAFSTERKEGGFDLLEIDFVSARHSSNLVKEGRTLARAQAGRVRPAPSGLRIFAQSD